MDSNSFDFRQVIGLRVMMFGAILLLMSSSAYGQGIRPSASPPPDATRNDRDKDDDWSNEYGSPQNEIRMKMLLKEERKRYDENVERAREVSQLAAQLRQIYISRQTFDNQDAKRLERLEKLTKRIRNEAGGSESDTALDAEDNPSAMSEVLDRVAELASDLKKLVEKTPRQVVSASVISQANKLIGLVQRVRGDNKR